MTLLIDARWLLLIPFGAIFVFFAWAFWNISKDIRAHKRRRVRTFRSSRITVLYP